MSGEELLLTSVSVLQKILLPLFTVYIKFSASQDQAAVKSIRHFVLYSFSHLAVHVALSVNTPEDSCYSSWGVVVFSTIVMTQLLSIHHVFSLSQILNLPVLPSHRGSLSFTQGFSLTNIYFFFFLYFFYVWWWCFSESRRV